MNDSASQTKRISDWWKVMEQACDAMTRYASLLDSDGIPATELQKLKAELLEKASRLNRLAEEIITEKMAL